MRKWHRWLSVIFGVIMLWIAVTGVLSQAAALWPSGAPARATPPAGFVCPEMMICRPKPAPGSTRGLVGVLHHLHSGESFGPVGTLLSILGGFALIFFAISGLWLYAQMWLNRSRRGIAPRWFWK
ncbi:MAG: PepSY domain-containing protein [Sphingomonas sp.]|nr:PepSY domain-containing protein [Sphingomonas sp.]MBX9883142.1 PepSY domain-containing protein [Sphingomonas sp.]